MSEVEVAYAEIAHHIREKCDLRTSPEGWKALRHIYGETLGGYLKDHPEQLFWDKKRFRRVMYRVIEDIIWEAQRDGGRPDPNHLVTAADLERVKGKVFKHYHGTCIQLIRDLGEELTVRGAICGER